MSKEQPAAPPPERTGSYGAICPICESSFQFNEPEPLEKLYEKWEQAIRREAKERALTRAARPVDESKETP